MVQPPTNHQRNASGQSSSINRGGGGNSQFITLLGKLASAGAAGSDQRSAANLQGNAASFVQHGFDYKQYLVPTKYTYDQLLRNYLEMLQPSFKQKLTNLVSSEDDLGPEVILNLKWLDTYRYNQKSIFYYLDLVQELKERYNWQ